VMEGARHSMFGAYEIKRRPIGATRPRSKAAGYIKICSTT